MLQNSSSLNYLVIGASGTIGSALFAQLQKNNAAVWGTTHKQLPQQTSNIFHLNLSDPPASWQFPDVQFDVVYFCAGICRMAGCEDDPLATHKINVDATIKLIEHFAKSGALIAYLSTNQVFDGNEPHMKADALYNPQNEYGRQKVKVETFLRQAIQYSAIVRLTKVMTPVMPLITDWITRLKNHQPIDAFCDMMLAPVTLQQVIRVLILIGEKKQTGIFQISGANDLSYYDLATYFAKQLDRPLSLVQQLSALDKGIKKNFLPLFTSLDCSSTIAFYDEMPLFFSKVADTYLG